MPGSTSARFTAIIVADDRAMCPARATYGDALGGPRHDGSCVPPTLWRAKVGPCLRGQRTPACHPTRRIRTAGNKASRIRERSLTSLVNTRSPRRAADATTMASTSVASGQLASVSPASFARDALSTSM